MLNKIHENLMTRLTPKIRQSHTTHLVHPNHHDLHTIGQWEHVEALVGTLAWASRARA